MKEKVIESVKLYFEPITKIKWNRSKIWKLILNVVLLGLLIYLWIEILGIPEFHYPYLFMSIMSFGVVVCIFLYMKDILRNEEKEKLKKKEILKNKIAWHQKQVNIFTKELEEINDN